MMVVGGVSLSVKWITAENEKKNTPHPHRRGGYPHKHGRGKPPPAPTSRTDAPPGGVPPREVPHRREAAGPDHGEGYGR
jgi:hypothetical protein